MSQVNPLLKNVLIKLQLLRKDDFLPVPIGQTEGEYEGSSTVFHFMSDADNQKNRLLAIKEFKTAQAAEAAWDVIDSARKSAAPESLLPVSGNKRSDKVMIFDDGDHLFKLLRSLKLLKSKAPLPRPTTVLSGLAGFSRGYFLNIPSESGESKNNQLILAKFDRPDRAVSEWREIQQRRNDTRARTTWPAPFMGNCPRHGIIIYPLFHGQTTSGRVENLGELLQRVLLTDQPRTKIALALLFQELEGTYINSSADVETKTWADYQEEVNSSQKEIVAIINGATSEPQNNSSNVGIFTGGIHRSALPHPAKNLSSRLETSVARIRKGTVHGDLQSTNILFGFDLNYQPNALAIVDLEAHRPHGIIAQDLARLEGDFWRTVFPELVRGKSFDDPNSQRQMVRGIIAIHQALAGMDRIVPPMSEEYELILARSAQFVFELRKRAISILQTNGPSLHDLNHYFHALLFFYHKSLLRRMVNRDASILRNVIVAASSVEHVLGLIETGQITTEPLLPASFEDVRKLLRPDKARQTLERAQRVFRQQTLNATPEINTAVPIEIKKFSVKGKWPDVSQISNLAISPLGNAIAYTQDSDICWHLLDEANSYGKLVGSHRKSVNEGGNNRSATITGMTFSPCGQFVLSVDDKGGLMVWSCQTLELVEMTQISGQSLSSIAFSADGKLCATAGWDNVIRIFDTARISDGPIRQMSEIAMQFNRQTRPRHDHEREVVTAMAFSPKERCLATGDEKGAMAIYHIAESGAVTIRLRARPHQQHIHSLSFCIDRPELLMTGSGDSRIRITNLLSNDQEHLTLGTGDRKHLQAVNSVAFSSKGDIAVSAARDGLVKVWDVMNLKWLDEIKVADEVGWVDKVAFFPNVYNFATNTYANNVTLWNVTNTGQVVRTSVGKESQKH